MAIIHHWQETAGIGAVLSLVWLAFCGHRAKINEEKRIDDILREKDNEPNSKTATVAVTW